MLTDLLARPVPGTSEYQIISFPANTPYMLKHTDRPQRPYWRGSADASHGCFVHREPAFWSQNEIETSSRREQIYRQTPLSHFCLEPMHIFPDPMAPIAPPLISVESSWFCLKTFLQFWICLHVDRAWMYSSKRCSSCRPPSYFLSWHTQRRILGFFITHIQVKAVPRPLNHRSTGGFTDHELPLTGSHSWNMSWTNLCVKCW